MTNLIIGISKINTGAKLWVVSLVLTYTLIWSVDTGTAPGGRKSAPTIATPLTFSVPQANQRKFPTSRTREEWEEKILLEADKAGEAFTGTPTSLQARLEHEAARRGVKGYHPSFTPADAQAWSQLGHKTELAKELVEAGHPYDPSTPSNAMVDTLKVVKARSNTDDLGQERPSQDDPPDPHSSAPVDLVRPGKQSASKVPLTSPKPQITTKTSVPDPNRAAGASKLSRPILDSSFTVGSTKDEVLAVQGTPTSFSEDRWSYGLSAVDFQGGRVTTWDVSPYNSLRVKMVPDSHSNANAARARGYFTVGSTKDEVLAVQGTPTSFSEAQWSYGLSTVDFQDDRVTTWDVSPYNSLKAVLSPNQ